MEKNYSAYIEAPELSEKYIDAGTYEIERALESIYDDPSEDWPSLDYGAGQDNSRARYMNIKDLREDNMKNPKRNEQGVLTI